MCVHTHRSGSTWVDGLQIGWVGLACHTQLPLEQHIAVVLLLLCCTRACQARAWRRAAGDVCCCWCYCCAGAAVLLVLLWLWLGLPGMFPQKPQKQQQQQGLDHSGPSPISPSL